MREMVLILDFGGQYKELIARRVRECGVYSEIRPCTMAVEEIRALAPRGIIYDCNGEELANNKPGVMVSLVRRTDAYPEETLKRLSQLLHIPLSEIKETIRLSGGSSEPIRLVRNASPEVVDKVEENLRYLPGVMLEVQPVRNYPNKGLAVHALGYVGEISDYEISQGAYSELKAGDIIVVTGHVGIIGENGTVIDASSSQGKICHRKLSSWWSSRFICGWRIFE